MVSYFVINFRLHRATEKGNTKEKAKKETEEGSETEQIRESILRPRSSQSPQEIEKGVRKFLNF